MDHPSTPETTTHSAATDFTAKTSTTAPGSVGRTTVIDNGKSSRSARGTPGALGSGGFLACVSIVILGLSAPLYSFFKEEADDYIPELSRLYLYCLIVSAFGIFTGILVVLRIYRYTHSLVMLLQSTLLYIAGYGWSIYHYYRTAKNIPYKHLNLALVIFLGIGGFLGLINFLREFFTYRASLMAKITSQGANGKEKKNPV